MGQMNSNSTRLVHYCIMVNTVPTTCANLEIEVKLRSGFYGQNWSNDWCHSFDCGPDLNLTSISTVRGVEIGEIRVSVVQPRLNYGNPNFPPSSA